MLGITTQAYGETFSFKTLLELIQIPKSEIFDPLNDRWYEEIILITVDYRYLLLKLHHIIPDY